MLPAYLSVCVTKDVVPICWHIMKDFVPICWHNYAIKGHIIMIFIRPICWHNYRNDANMLAVYVYSAFITIQEKIAKN